MTRWLAKNTKSDLFEGHDYISTIFHILASGQIWADLPLDGANSEPEEAWMRKELLSFIRVAGITSHLLHHHESYESLTDSIQNLVDELKESSVEDVLELISVLALSGWRALMADGPPPVPAHEDKGDIYSITNDRSAHLAVADSRKTIKADAAARLFEVSCKGVTWAIIDSGIDALHPAFEKTGTGSASAPPKSRVTRTFDFSCLRDLLLGGDEHPLPDRYDEPPRRELLEKVRKRADKFYPIDWGLMLPLLELDSKHYVAPSSAHGTHVAGILGAHWPSAPRGPMTGMCPDIKLIDIRVCRPNGSSDEFIVTAALQFVRYLNAHADMMAVHGVNISLSLEHDVSNYACGRTPVCLEAERTMQSGVVVVAAAGNRGYRHIRAADETSFYQFCAVSITDPGNAEGVITVGSTHRREPHNYGVSYFSSRGPTGDGRIKPDLVAPGEKIYAPSPHGDAITLDGTSMAAPHVSAAAAMLIARHPELMGQPARIKKILCESATDLGREKYFQGHGLVDVLRALQSV
jgi:subtilisin family serine protease